MVLFLQQRGRLTQAFMDVGQVIPNFVNSSVSARRIAEIMELPPEKHSEKDKPIEIPDGGIRLVVDDVEFYYEEGENVIEKGLKNVKHPCRFEYIKDKNLIIDGAHNPNGIKGLMQSLEMYYPNTKRRFIFGCLRNKEYGKMVNILTPLSNQLPQGAWVVLPEIYFYHFSHQNSATFEELKAVCPASCKELTKDTKIDFNDGHLNIICGSFYMLSELLELFGINPDSL
jgi:folylpolyglutamate synthase/dihydropteroate synthase